MDVDGEYRLGANGLWEVYVQDPTLTNIPGADVGTWIDVAIVNPAQASLLNGYYDDVQYDDSGNPVFHTKGGDQSANTWHSVDQVMSGRALVGSHKPADWDKLMPGIAYPPTKLQTRRDASTNFLPVTESTPDLATIQRYDSLKNSQARIAILQQRQGSYAANINSEIANRQFQQNLAATRLQAQYFVPRTLERSIVDALQSGQWDKALAIDDFRQRPNSLQRLQFAMQYATGPEDFKALYNVASGQFDQATLDRAFRVSNSAAMQQGYPATPLQNGMPGSASDSGTGVGRQRSTAYPVFSDTPNTGFLQQAAQPTSQFNGVGGYGVPFGPQPNWIATAQNAAIQAGINPETGEALPPPGGFNPTASNMPPGSAFHNTPDSALQAIIQAPEASESDRQAAQAEFSRRASLGTGGTFSSFMQGGPAVGNDLTASERALQAAGPRSNQIAPYTRWEPGQGFVAKPNVDLYGNSTIPAETEFQRQLGLIATNYLQNRLPNQMTPQQYRQNRLQPTQTSRYAGQ